MAMTLIHYLISSLPDAMLTHILSFLETKESVSTSVLSTRWRYLFAFVPVLDFHIPDRYPNLEEFKIFVNQMLSLHDISCTIRMFRINIGRNRCKVSDVSSLIDAAIRSNAQIIGISVRQFDIFYPLPNDLYTCQVLVELKLLGAFVINVTCPVSLPSLKTINISGCKFGRADSANRLFSSCPVLEDLSVWACQIMDSGVISISVPLLKRLSIFSSFPGCEWELNNVPNLKTLALYIHNSYKTKCWSVHILKSLWKASIKVNSGEDSDMICNLVNKFKNVRILSLSGYGMESSSLASGSYSLPIFNKLTSLKLRADFSRGCKFFPILLGRSPCLKELVIGGDGFLNCNEDILEVDILMPTHIPLCFSLSLEEVHLYEFKGGKVGFEWLGYLLKNADVLKELTVFVSSVDYGEEVEIRKKLLALPKGSKKFKHLNCYILHPQILCL